MVLSQCISSDKTFFSIFFLLTKHEVPGWLLMSPSIVELSSSFTVLSQLPFFSFNELMSDHTFFRYGAPRYGRFCSFWKLTFFLRVFTDPYSTFSLSTAKDMEKEYSLEWIVFLRIWGLLLNLKDNTEHTGDWLDLWRWRVQHKFLAYWKIFQFSSEISMIGWPWHLRWLLSTSYWFTWIFP